MDGLHDLLLACLHDAAFLPLLALGVALDGPVPVLPTEVVAMSAALGAGAAGDVGALLGLWSALVLGPLVGTSVWTSVAVALVLTGGLALAAAVRGRLAARRPAAVPSRCTWSPRRDPVTADPDQIAAG